MQKTAEKDSHVEEPSLIIANKARESLKNLNGWQLTDDHKMIYREFILHDFAAAIDLIDRIALIAEDEKHHPDVHLTKYRNLRVGLTTHDVGGLSEKDFIIAQKINDLPLFTNKNNKAIGINQQLQNKTESKSKPVKKAEGISPVIKKKENKKKGIQFGRNFDKTAQPVKRA